MTQITWRNIDAPDLGGVARLQLAGNQSIRDAISGLLAPIQQNQQLSNINFNTARTQNTADIQNQLLGFTDPAQLDAARTEFNPDTLRKRFGAAVDQSAINQTLATRPGQLRQDLQGQIQLEQAQKEQASQPYENQFYSLLASNPAQAEQFLRANEANFADSRQLYSDLTNRRQQIEQATLQRAQLAESRAARQEARADRMDARTQRQNLNSYAKELNEWVLQNPDKPIGTKAAELQKKYDINPVTGNQVAGAVAQNIATLGAPTPAQTAVIQNQSTLIKEAADQYKADATQEVNAAFLSSGIDPTVFNLQDDKKTSADDVIKSLQGRLADPNEATEAYTRAKKAYPNATPATIGYIVEKSLSPSRWGGLADGVTISFGDVESNAKDIMKTANNAAAKQALIDALRLVDKSGDTLMKQASAPLVQFQRNIPKANVTGTDVPAFQPVVPDYAGQRQELRKFLEDTLGNPKVNTSTR